MKQQYIKRMLFISKSLLWSVLCYVAVVLAIDWEEMLARLQKEQPAAFIMRTEQPVVSSPNVVYHLKISGIAIALWHQLTLHSRH